MTWPVPAAAEPQATAGDRPPISFGPFRLLPTQRLLLEGDTPVRLGSRAFDILAALVDRAGEVVGKEELIARAWPRTIVEEANLKFQVSGLRRALGDGQGGHRYVVTVPGRGYNFVAPVRLQEPAQVPLPPTIAPAGVHNLPLAVTRMIGRDEAVAALVSQLSRQRLLTIVGPGGIGKTTLALAVAERMICQLRARRLAGRPGAAQQPAPGAERSCHRARPGCPFRGSASRPGRRPQGPAHAAAAR